MEFYEGNRKVRAMGWMPVWIGAACLLVGVPLFVSERLQSAGMEPLRMLCGALGMGGLILTPFTVLFKCFESWDRER